MARPRADVERDAGPASTTQRCGPARHGGRLGFEQPSGAGAEHARSLGADAYRAGHQWGNRMLTGAVARIFGHLLTDILSGYRAFSRRFVKSFPAMASGFEIETELTIHSLQLRLPVGEIDTPYFARPEGSASKLNTYRDGFRILGTIVRLFVLEKPFQFFGLLALVLMLGEFAVVNR